MEPAEFVGLVRESRHGDAYAAFWRSGAPLGYWHSIAEYAHTEDPRGAVMFLINLRLALLAEALQNAERIVSDTSIPLERGTGAELEFRYHLNAASVLVHVPVQFALLPLDP